MHLIRGFSLSLRFTSTFFYYFKYFCNAILIVYYTFSTIKAQLLSVHKTIWPQSRFWTFTYLASEADEVETNVSKKNSNIWFECRLLPDYDCDEDNVEASMVWWYVIIFIDLITKVDFVNSKNGMYQP